MNWIANKVKVSNKSRRDLVSNREWRRVSQSVSVFVIQIVQGTPGTTLCNLRVTPSVVFIPGNLGPLRGSPRALRAVSAPVVDTPIAREGRLYNTEPNLVVYF